MEYGESLQHILLDVAILSLPASLKLACVIITVSPNFWVCREPIQRVFVGGYSIENHVLFSLRSFPVRTPPYYTEVISCSPVPKFQSQHAGLSSS